MWWNLSYLWASVLIYIYLNIWIYIYTHTHTHTYIYIYIYIYIYLPKHAFYVFWIRTHQKHEIRRNFLLKYTYCSCQFNQSFLLSWHCNFVGFFVMYSLLIAFYISANCNKQKNMNLIKDVSAALSIISCSLMLVSVEVIMFRSWRAIYYAKCIANAATWWLPYCTTMLYSTQRGDGEL